MKSFKWSVMTVMILVSTVTSAASCRSDAITARERGVHHLVISFEGLASYFAGFVRKGLIAPLARAHGDEFFSMNYAYTSSAKAAACVREWKSVQGSHLRVTVIGHSFGGGIAVPAFLSAARDIDFETVITLDPRSWSADANAARTKSLDQFAAPANVRRFFNFYQRGGMPGYRVLGAENYQIQGTTHTALPRNSTVIRAVDDLLF